MLAAHHVPFHVAAAIAQLEGLPGRDELADDMVGLIDEPARVFAQVQHHPLGARQPIRQRCVKLVCRRRRELV